MNKIIPELLSKLEEKLKQTQETFNGLGFIAKTIIAMLRQIPQEVVKVNSAMITLRESSHTSASEVSNYFEEAAKSSKKYGVSVSDMLNTTASWSKLGYSLPDSKLLAEAAALYANISDSLEAASANEALLSALQGFRLTAKDAMEIIDQFHEVADSFPISSAGISEALQKSAAAFHSANTNLSKSIALIAGADSAIRNPDATGAMWETVAMRIRGAKQELEDAGIETDGILTSTAQLRALIQNLTGFDIVSDESETQLKDVYDIVVGIGQKWQTLTGTEQTRLLDALAGKSQQTALNTALNNVSAIEKAYKTAENSAGSALKGQENYEQGIQYSLDRLAASFETFANHILDSDFLKGIVDFGNGTVNLLDNVTDKLGSLGTISAIGGGIAGAKGLG